MTPPTLDDDRIDTMRVAVMSAVRTDQQRRGRRVRRVAGGVAAAAVLVVAGTAGTTLVRSGSDLTSADSGSSGSSSGAAAESAPDPDAPTAPESTERQVVTTGQATVVASDPRREASRISAWVERLGGRVDARDEQGGDDTSARLTVRLPPGQVDAAVDLLADSGRVESVSFQDEDVTASVVDLDARIRALRISIDRLEDILTEADSNDQVIAAEGALTERQSQLESLTAQRDALGEDVALARLDIELVQRDGADDVDPGGFRGGLTAGWNALVGTVDRVVEVAGALLPWAVVGIVGYGAARVVRRVRRS